MNNLTVVILLLTPLVALYFTLLYFFQTRGIIRKNLSFDNVIKLYKDKKYFMAEKAFLLLSNSEEDILSNEKKGSFFYDLACVYCKEDLLADGLGVKINNKKAISYLKQSSNLGYSHASYCLSHAYKYYWPTPDYKIALEYIELAIRQSSSDWYKYILGNFYLEGDGVDKDVDAGLKLYEESANSNPNNPTAQFKLGLFYENGEYVDKNPDLAIDWYEKAANNGHEAAKEKLKKLTKPKKVKKEVQA
jgi:TPR repeat protein